MKKIEIDTPILYIMMYTWTMFAMAWLGEPSRAIMAACLRNQFGEIHEIHAEGREEQGRKPGIGGYQHTGMAIGDECVRMAAMASPGCPA